MTAPTRGYVICSEHRSGSTLLCQRLDATGVMGHPAEYFARTEHSVAIERDPALLDALLARAATANGVYGIKLFSQQFDATMKARWLERLPAPRFIHLERQDLLGQAISLVRALQTGQYRAHEPMRAPAQYDRRAIARHLARLVEANGRWRAYFARNGIDVLWLQYEAVARDPDAAVRAVAAHVGIALPATPPATPDRLRVQRDTLSDAWRARFIADAGDPGYLDHPLGRPRIWARRAARDAGLLLRRLGGRHGRGGDAGSPGDGGERIGRSEAPDRPFEH